MEYKLCGINKDIVFFDGDQKLITDSQTALDFIMSAQYLTGCNRLIIKESSLCDDFFDLRTGLAGEVFQKCMNYHFKLAIIGDFSKYKSKALQDLIYECNKGQNIFFVETLEAAIARLT